MTKGRNEPKPNTCCHFCCKKLKCSTEESVRTCWRGHVLCALCRTAQPNLRLCSDTWSDCDICKRVCCDSNQETRACKTRRRSNRSKGEEDERAAREDQLEQKVLAQADEIAALQLQIRAQCRCSNRLQEEHVDEVLLMQRPTIAEHAPAQAHALLLERPTPSTLEIRTGQNANLRAEIAAELAADFKVIDAAGKKRLLVHQPFERIRNWEPPPGSFKFVERLAPPTAVDLLLSKETEVPA
jgi:hypothetical protein